MSSQTERLERVAAEERERLASHLETLQNQIERAVDPKMVYHRHPLPVLGAVLCAGVVLGAVTNGGRRHRRPGRVQQFVDGVREPSAWGELRGAMVGMVAARLGDILYDMVSRSLHMQRDERAADALAHGTRSGGEKVDRARTATA